MQTLAAKPHATNIIVIIVNFFFAFFRLNVISIEQNVRLH